MVMYASSSAFFIRLRLAVKAFHVPHIAKCLFSSAANFGKNTAAVRFPLLTNLSSSDVDMPIALAASWNAPGRRSPNWPAVLPG